MKEILAPVGNKEMLITAINNGADAVYLGASKFNARMKADNFDNFSLNESVKLAHLFNTKVYLTLNTLVNDSELPELIDTINEAVKAKVDAFIVQDYGTSYILKKYYPNAIMHASTQLGVHNKDGAIIAEKMGFKRVVLSREATIEDIKEIKKSTSLEIEYFVHGALCVAFSGNCYLSSYVKNKSGNRGECLQLCRLFYKAKKDINKLSDNNTNEISTKNDIKTSETTTKNDKISSKNNVCILKNNNALLKGDNFSEGYLLSTRDLCYLEKMQQLSNAGVDSFKIEGRLKRPSYVAKTVSLYKKAILGEKITKQDEQELRLIFSRGEFNKGQYLDNQNDNVINPMTQNHQGVKIGKVVKTEKFKDLHKIFIKSDYNINVGDGLKFVSQDNFINSMGVGNVEKVKDLQVVYSKAFPTVSDDVYLTVDSKLENELLNKKRKIKVDFKFVAKINQQASLTIILNDKSISDKELQITTKSDYFCQKAVNSKVSQENIIKNLSKLGDTNFTLINTDIVLDDCLFIPLVEVNRLRRECVKKLEELIIENNSQYCVVCDKNKILDDLNEIKSQLEIKFTDIKQTICNNLNYITTKNDKISKNDKIIIISPEIYSIINIKEIIDNMSQQNNHCKFYLDLPIIENYKDIKVLKNILDNFKDLGIVINNIYGLNLAINRDVILGVYLNISNTFAYKHLMEIIGGEYILAFSSKEYFSKMDCLLDYNGNFDIMTMKHCPFKLCYGNTCKDCSYNKGLVYKMQSGQEFVIKRKKIFNCYFTLQSN